MRALDSNDVAASGACSCCVGGRSVYDYLLGMIESFIRYGMSPTALVVALVAFFRTKRFKRFISRRIPMLFRDDADVLNYQARQIRIEQDVRAIKAHLGVEECHVESKFSSIDTANRSITPLLAGGWFARFVNVRTDLITKIIHFEEEEQNEEMVQA